MLVGGNQTKFYEYPCNNLCVQEVKIHTHILSQVCKFNLCVWVWAYVCKFYQKLFVGH